MHAAVESERVLVMKAGDGNEDAGGRYTSVRTPDSSLRRDLHTPQDRGECVDGGAAGRRVKWWCESGEGSAVVFVVFLCLLRDVDVELSRL